MFKKLFLATSLALCFPASVLARAVEYVPQRQAQGLESQPAEVILYQGYGDTIIDFRDLDEVIRQINIGDSSRMVVNSDDPECLSHAASRSHLPCQAQILYLKQIKPIVLDELYTATWTELKVVTDSNIYVFKIVYSTSPPTSSIYKLQANKVINPTQNSLLDRYLVMRRGYRLGRQKDYINEELGQRIEKFLQAVYKGTSVVEAAQKEGISPEAVDKLELLGELSDGALEVSK